MAIANWVSNADTIDAAVDRALEIIGGKCETYAKKACPVDTGHLKNSITHQVRGDTVTIGTNVEYAPYVELGHRQQPGRYVPAIGKRLVNDHVDGKPFLAPALENHINEYLNVIKAELQKL